MVALVDQDIAADSNMYVKLAVHTDHAYIEVSSLRYVAETGARIGMLGEAASAFIELPAYGEHRHAMDATP